MNVQITSSPADTELLAAGLAARLRPGDFVALHGDLGAGKTCFVRGLVRGLGGDAGVVCSPTFVLLNVYDVAGPSGRVYHLDAYRVAGEGDLESIGFSEVVAQGGITVVEWPTRVPGLIPADALHVELRAHPTNPADRPNHRSLRISGTPIER